MHAREQIIIVTRERLGVAGSGEKAQERGGESGGVVGS
jgi:hypothetical protein